MILNEKNGVKYFTFDKLSGLRHCFSTRVGGVSEGCYESLNLAFRQDKKENVLENYRRIADAVGVDVNNTVWTRQIHTDNILRVDERWRGVGLFSPRPENGYDGIITDCSDVVLTAFSADCVIILLYDLVKKAIGAVHSGWRGTVLKIGAKAVKAMEREFNTDPQDLICCIAPAIGGCCFQVDRPVVDEFLAAIPSSTEFIKPDAENEGKYYIDLHSVNERILLDMGVLPQNIENSRFCTRCHPELFYSHRLMGDKRGTMAAMISL